MKLTYVVLRDKSDDDWGLEFSDLAEAEENAAYYRELGWPEAFVGLVGSDLENPWQQVVYTLAEFIERKKNLPRGTFYVADAEYADEIYGSQFPGAYDLEEVERLAEGWGMSTDELLDQMHEADENEMALYGVYISSLKKCV